MVEVVITATDPSDSYARAWGIFIDKVPPVGWERSQDPNIEVHHSGDTMHRSLDLPDGAHNIYFVVSQTGGPGLGSYSGTAQFDDKSSQFSGAGESAAMKFAITVSGNKVTSEASTSPMSFQDKAWNWIKTNWKHLAAGGAATGVVAIGAVVASKSGGRRL